MELRKIQKTGGASFSIILPKSWIKRSKLKDKDFVRISQENAYALNIQPARSKQSTKKSFLKIENINDSATARELIAHYISGADEIIIFDQKLSGAKRTKIRSLCNLMIGFEMFDESSEKIIIKNVFDPAKFPLFKNLEKMFFITSSMINDSYKALTNHDISLAKDVIERDLEIDRLQISITRQLYICIRKDISMEEINLDDIDLYFFQTIATWLERIADHAVKIARNVSSKDITGTPISTSVNVVNNLLSLLEKSKIMIKKLDKKTAHEILDSSTEIENQIYSKKTRKHKFSIAWDVLEDSLDRIRGYIMNISELTIDQAVLREIE